MNANRFKKNATLSAWIFGPSVDTGVVFGRVGFGERDCSRVGGHEMIPERNSRSSRRTGPQSSTPTGTRFQRTSGLGQSPAARCTRRGHRMITRGRRRSGGNGCRFAVPTLE